MIDLEQVPETRDLDLARECVHRFLSTVVADPFGPAWERALDPEGQELAIAAMDLIGEWASQDPFPLTFGELGPEFLDLRPLTRWLSGSIEEVRAEYGRVFGLVVPKECPPYETEYHPPSHTFYRSQQMADIAGFYRAFGVTPADLIRERPDHLMFELEFIALLLTKRRLVLDESGPGPEAVERLEVCDRALRDFVRDHLIWWVPAFATGLRRKADHGPYEALAKVLAALVPVERRRLDLDPPFPSAKPALIEPPEEQPGCNGCPALS